MLSAKRGESGVRRATRVCGDGRELTRRAAGRVNTARAATDRARRPMAASDCALPCTRRAGLFLRDCALLVRPPCRPLSLYPEGPGARETRAASGARRPLGLAASHVHVPRAGVLGGDIPLWKRHELSPGWSPIRAGGREASASVPAAEKGKLQDGLRMVAAMKADDSGRL